MNNKSKNKIGWLNCVL